MILVKTRYVYYLKNFLHFLVILDAFHPVINLVQIEKSEVYLQDFNKDLENLKQSYSGTRENNLIYIHSFILNSKNCMCIKIFYLALPV